EALATSTHASSAPDAVLTLFGDRPLWAAMTELHTGDRAIGYLVIAEEVTSREAQRGATRTGVDWALLSGGRILATSSERPDLKQVFATLAAGGSDEGWRV